MKKAIYLLLGAALLAGCEPSGGWEPWDEWDDGDEETQSAKPAKSAKAAAPASTPGEMPTVDYIRGVNPGDAAHRNVFLRSLTTNYRSYAIYNADVSKHPDIGELFAQKAAAAFSGETPMPETLDDWKIADAVEKTTLQDGCQKLVAALRNDAALKNPKFAAEAQAKFDCWLSATASEQTGTAKECRKRFDNAMAALGGGQRAGTGLAYSGDHPNTAEIGLLTDTKRVREGIVIVNNVNIPGDYARPVQSGRVVFNQNVYPGGAGAWTRGGEDGGAVGAELVSRDEFLNMMMALRSEIQEINRKLAGGDSAEIKVVQFPGPTEPKQKIVEEIFEVKFDFNKSEIKPEYQAVVQKLAATARENRNVKISIIGHTDTVGSDGYNYALGGRRAETVKNVLISHGIPASAIIVVSSGKNDLKVPTGNNVNNAENRRVRVVKEVRYVGQGQGQGGGQGQPPQEQ